MQVRVYDEKTNTYFKSKVYAIINSGWYEKRLVIAPSESGGYFKFFDYLDKSNPAMPKALINTISFDDFYMDSNLTYKKTDDVDKQLDEYAKLLKSDIHFFEYRGYPWIYENKALLVKLLKGDCISVKEYEKQALDPNDYKLDGWNYIETQQDIDFIFEQTFSFHDSVLKELNYISGSYVDDDNTMFCTDSMKQISMRFGSQWCKPIEIVFEGVIALNLRPRADNYESCIYEASLFIQDETIFFFDSKINAADRFYDGTWVQSFRMRWKFLEK